MGHVRRCFFAKEGRDGFAWNKSNSVAVTPGKREQVLRLRSGEAVLEKETFRLAPLRMTKA
jgi:hypothetical protein